MSKELTIFKNGAVASTAFAKAHLPKSRLGEGIQGGMPWKHIGYKGKDWSVNDGSVVEYIMRTVDGQREKNPYLDIVIIKAASHPTRKWYAEDYKDGDNRAPDCYSTKGFKPDAAAENKQEGKDIGCLNCRWSQWNSKEGSRGKACREYSVLAVVPVGDIPNLINRGPMQMPIPPNSLKALKNYGAQLDALGLHYAQVHTRVKFAEGQLFEMDFDALGVLDDVQAEQVVQVLQNPMVDRILDEEVAPAPSDDVGGPQTASGTVHKLAPVEAKPETRPNQGMDQPHHGHRDEAAPATPAPTPDVQPQPVAETPAPAPKLTAAEQEIADLKAKLAAMEKAQAPADKPKRGRPRSNGNRTPQVAPTNMDSEKLAGPQLPEPVGAPMSSKPAAAANDTELPVAGNDPALAKLNDTLNRAKDLI